MRAGVSAMVTFGDRFRNCVEIRIKFRLGLRLRLGLHFGFYH